MFGFALKPQQSGPDFTITRTDSCITRDQCLAWGGKQSVILTVYIRLTACIVGLPLLPWLILAGIML
jgi:hypothetical protein